MKLNKTVIAALAVMALGLSACGGDTAPAPAETTAQASVEEAAPVETEEAAPIETAEATLEAEEDVDLSGSPFDEGEVDTEEFQKRYAAGQATVRTVTITQSTEADLSELQLPEGIELPEGMDFSDALSGVAGRSVTYVDATDRDNVRSYTVIESGHGKSESVTVGGTWYIRAQGSEWVAQEIPDLEESYLEGADNLTQSINSARLVSKAERQFAVTVDLTSTVGESPLGSDMEMNLWLDEQFRLIKQVVVSSGVTITNVYSNFNEPVDIPDVG